jgi:integrase
MQYRSPRKVASEQKADERRKVMWTRWFGADKDLSKIGLSEWEAFQDARSAGVIDSRGRRIAKKKRKPVRARTVEGDLIWLTLVLDWATKWRDSAGRYLLRENPVRGFELPSEKNIRRPIATQDRFEAIRAISDTVEMEVRWNGKREKQRSYLSDLLDIVNGTGRRISAVCGLRYDDLSLNSAKYGVIRWRADTEKTGRETQVPINGQVRAAIDRVLRERPGVGEAYLFPSPVNATRPIRRELASEWLKRAEVIAKVPPLAGGQWHPYRRKWATERKHMPDVDVAAAGGWAELSSLKKAYQHADDATMLKVVLEGGELREQQA